MATPSYSVSSGPVSFKVTNLTFDVITNQARLTEFHEAAIHQVTFLGCSVLRMLDVRCSSALNLEPDDVVDLAQIEKSWLNASGFSPADDDDPTLASVRGFFYALPAMVYLLHGEGYDEIRILLERESSMVTIVLRLAPMHGVEDVFLRELTENLLVGQHESTGQ